MSPRYRNLIRTLIIVPAIALATIAIAFSPTATSAEEAPPPPHLQAAVHNPPGFAHLEWNEVPGAISYHVWHAPADTKGLHYWTNLKAPRDNVTLAGLDPSKQYTFHIMAKVSIANSQTPGWTLWSQPADATHGDAHFRLQDLAGLVNLTELNMSGLGISTVSPDLFHDLGNLQNIDLSYNRVKNLPPDLFTHTPELTKISLSQNRIDHVDAGAFNGLRSLQAICLGNNLLETLPDQAIHVDKHPDLHRVSLFHNPGSEGQLAGLSIHDQTNAQGVRVFTCLALDENRQCVKKEP